MTKPLKIVEMDGAAVVVLPPEMLIMLKASIGGTVYLSGPAADTERSSRDGDPAHKLAVVGRIMREDRDNLPVLAQ